MKVYKNDKNTNMFLVVNTKGSVIHKGWSYTNAWLDALQEKLDDSNIYVVEPRNEMIFYTSGDVIQIC